MKITALNYEQQRMKYFKKQYHAYERKLDYWINAMRIGKHGYSQAEYEDKCSECGVRIGFYADVIKMLGGEIPRIEEDTK